MSTRSKNLFSGVGLRLHPELPLVTEQDIVEVLDQKQISTETRNWRSREGSPTYAFDVEDNVLIVIDKDSGVHVAVTLKPEAEFIAQYKQRYHIESRREYEARMERTWQEIAAKYNKK